jgi:hypothetical protein
MDGRWDVSKRIPYMMDGFHGTSISITLIEQVPNGIDEIVFTGGA